MGRQAVSYKHYSSCISTIPNGHANSKNSCLEPSPSTPKAYPKIQPGVRATPNPQDLVPTSEINNLHASSHVPKAMPTKVHIIIPPTQSQSSQNHPQKPKQPSLIDSFCFPNPTRSSLNSILLSQCVHLSVGSLHSNLSPSKTLLSFSSKVTSPPPSKSTHSPVSTTRIPLLSNFHPISFLQ
jgi:hypothetical protein